MSRHLEWEGCFNVRDLGGLRVAGGGETRPGRIVRADALDGLTAAGWAALVGYGVRTVVDLRNEDERRGDAASRPTSVTTVCVPHDGMEDREFWDAWQSGPQFGTPLYYRPHLERMPERSAAVVLAIARAGPGGVAFHCGVGRDRAGLISVLLLAIAGVVADEIADDYALSAERLRARFAARGEPDQEPDLTAYLASRGTTAGEVLRELLAEVDLPATLVAGGATSEDLAAIRRRLLDP